MFIKETNQLNNTRTYIERERNHNKGNLTCCFSIMLTDIAASLLAKAISTTATSICLYTYSVNPSVCKDNIIACAMQHLHCKQQTLKKSQLYCQKRMHFGRWHHCCATGNNISQKQMCMLFGNQLDQTTFKNIFIKRLKRLNNRNNNKNNNHKGSCGRGGLSMKLYLTSSSMFNNNMMCGKLEKHLFIYFAFILHFKLLTEDVVC